MTNNEESNTWSKTLWKARLLAKAILSRGEDLRGGLDQKKFASLGKGRNVANKN